MLAESDKKGRLTRSLIHSREQGELRAELARNISLALISGKADIQMAEDLLEGKLDITVTFEKVENAEDV